MKINEITQAVIGAVIEVHRTLGPGLLESAYEEALAREFDLRGIDYQRQVPMPIVSVDHRFGLANASER